MDLSPFPVPVPEFLLSRQGALVPHPHPTDTQWPRHNVCHPSPSSCMSLVQGPSAVQGAQGHPAILQWGRVAHLSPCSLQPWDGLQQIATRAADEASDGCCSLWAGCPARISNAGKAKCGGPDKHRGPKARSWAVLKARHGKQSGEQCCTLLRGKAWALGGDHGPGQRDGANNQRTPCPHPVLHSDPPTPPWFLVFLACLLIYFLKTL